MSPETVELTPVARVVGGRTEVFEDAWGGSEAVIRLDEAFRERSPFLGLEDFSHLEVVFVFDRIAPGAVRTGPIPPRGQPDGAPVGVFAHRGPYRPNRLGVSRCRLLGVDGLDLHVVGLDALAGSPVLDIKPYMAEFAPSEPVVQPAWSTRLMSRYY
ncbi:SAM-dependent methyltransferase [Streptomyces genisteinicus]|uniref:SAM-dependent methyltransferase n=1 Tax=Streptomyces genisteinicus TaxID=2768068 RepID=A0A7H0HMI6_9ACTN|nr:SAM-dependent methyltransferase [Streptomyces genisteinicus]QNP61752.1 SAM-dependent methyltransferase [Streptomyces genisteinicus]